MTTRPSAELRRRVIERADHCCEYCCLPETFCASAHQVDHVIAEKHGGSTTFENLALSCMTCNLRKSSDIASLSPVTGELIPLFNPRRDEWSQHFRLHGVEIVGLTDIGRTTTTFLQLNASERRLERLELIRAGVFPIQQS